MNVVKSGIVESRATNYYETTNPPRYPPYAVAICPERSGPFSEEHALWRRVSFDQYIIMQIHCS